MSNTLIIDWRDPKRTLLRFPISASEVDSINKQLDDGEEWIIWTSVVRASNSTKVTTSSHRIRAEEICSISVNVVEYQ